MYYKLSKYMFNKRIVVSILFLLFSMGANAQPSVSGTNTKPTKKAHHHHKHKVHKAHKKVNKDYMHGIASFYGGSDGFDGRRMADGRIFYEDNPNLAAHPTLPLGTKLKVTNLDNNRSIYVEVTDRMAKRSRVIDLSTGGAKALGMHGRGTAPVSLTIISNSEYQEKKHTVEVDEEDSGNKY